MKLNIDQNLPVSVLFDKRYHDQVKEVVDKWRPGLINDDPSIETLELSSFEFDRSKIYFYSVIMDIMQLRKLGYSSLSIAAVARYFSACSNLSSSYATLYSRMRSYANL